ncbi:SDR family oxidoreductase [Jeotgalibacillus sp. R-1-5s-1]|uniref:SDR family NAD(P)-dependent oxidoreductase n=1 Tax=Jeotgalibacillus sp. R-1-5s-1 TaxID=2555897 RepID=UPI00106B1054|nr:SDR family oxidoreductase [Jeotgalibacillus sp. R-1-5s-1]TFE01242.1 SDR family oxidoreductase [Jeotgalibacillus sp. R-1-5s-1]
MKPTAIITGAGTGLGKELAKLLSNDYHIVLVGRRAALLNEVSAEISGTAIRCDITKEEDLEKLYKQLKSQDLLPVELVVNNAGVGHFGPLNEAQPDEWDEMFKTNVKGPMLLTKVLLPEMKAAGKGTFLNILSTAALRGKVNESGYVASKFAFRGFSESLAKEVEPAGIRVVRAYMGGMNTPFWDESDHVKNPGKMRSPKEVAEVIVKRMWDEDEIEV